MSFRRKFRLDIITKSTVDGGRNSETFLQGNKK